MTNERIVEPRLPFLDEGKFKTAVVRTACDKRDWCPDIKILVFTPVAQRKFCLYKIFMRKLYTFVNDCILCQAHDVKPSQCRTSVASW